jgi:hypothetical protein
VGRKASDLSKSQNTQWSPVRLAALQVLPALSMLLFKSAPKFVKQDVAPAFRNDRIHPGIASVVFESESNVNIPKILLTILILTWTLHSKDIFYH